MPEKDWSRLCSRREFSWTQLPAMESGQQALMHALEVSGEGADSSHREVLGI